MIDFARIVIRAGDGGNGSGSFHKIKGKRYGKADGGDGGRGGDVYVVASADLNTLEPYRYVKDYKAESGENGLSRLRRGGQGEELVLKVPVGTQVTSNEATEYDLVESGQKILIARGGEGGRGNAHLRDEFGRRPKVGEKGQEGELLNLTLELKLIADIGLIGLPNAGKSTLLSKLTSATPKIADYPFTTLEPNLGVCEGLVIADIPGLIEGASEGKGLGDLFLRHIERTKVLVHLVELAGIKYPEDAWGMYQSIRRELKSYSKELSKKREIIILTKIDLVEQGILDEMKQMFSKKRKKVLAISATSGKGLESLKNELLRYT